MCPTPPSPLTPPPALHPSSSSSPSNLFIIILHPLLQLPFLFLVRLPLLPSSALSHLRPVFPFLRPALGCCICPHFLNVLVRVQSNSELQQIVFAPPNFTPPAFKAIKVLRLPAFAQDGFYANQFLHKLVLTQAIFLHQLYRAYKLAFEQIYFSTKIKFYIS